MLKNSHQGGCFMASKVLINPNTHEVAARLEETKDGLRVKIEDNVLAQSIRVNGIAVCKGFADHKLHIYPNDNPEWFAKAFAKEFYPHGLAQKGFYWKNEENYSSPEGEIQEAIDRVHRAISAQS